MRGVLEIQEVARRPRLTQSQWNCGQCLKCVEAIDRRDDCNDEQEKMKSRCVKRDNYACKIYVKAAQKIFCDCFRDE